MKAQLRLTTNNLLLSLFFKRSLVQTVRFLDEIALKSNKENDWFYKRLAKTLSLHHQPLAKTLPGIEPIHIILRLENLEKANTRIPILLNLFKNNEKDIHINMLKNLDKFIHCLDTNTISKDIFHCVINGFYGSITKNAPLDHCYTLREVLMYVLAKLQAQDTEPAIRTNTTIVFVKISPCLEISKMEVVHDALTLPEKHPREDGNASDNHGRSNHIGELKSKPTNKPIARED
ncbi:hypothetical protein RFI_32804 [Reticulomyxa filosa]|uniref:Uncharacterized protein n=1 Tax=Reticulomyxa filosa TaxID=46433 RepID=X6LRS6_RETFI|nr:hypothetical protein RFI_32804 [Reticulomyxa filosa]|eukprot:ETO04593.1 hypothetical protein RFI_32804 [Reticulomyxa filosa]